MCFEKIIDEEFELYFYPLNMWMKTVISLEKTTTKKPNNNYKTVKTLRRKCGSFNIVC